MLNTDPQPQAILILNNPNDVKLWLTLPATNDMVDIFTNEGRVEIVSLNGTRPATGELREKALILGNACVKRAILLERRDNGETLTDVENDLLAGFNTGVDMLLAEIGTLPAQ